MTRTKCEIEQLGGNKSVLTSESDQHVGRAGTPPPPTEPVPEQNRRNGEYSSHYRPLLMSLSNITLRNSPGKIQGQLGLLLLSPFDSNILRIIEGR